MQPCCVALDGSWFGVFIWTSSHTYRSLSTDDIPLHKCAPVKIRSPIIICEGIRIQLLSPIVVCCCKLNNTWDCDEHLFGQVSTCTGGYQLLIFCCKIVHLWRYARPQFRRAVYLDKLVHAQVVINCQYSVAQLCTRKDTLAHNLSLLYFDDIITLTTSIFRLELNGKKCWNLNTVISDWKAK